MANPQNKTEIYNNLSGSLNSNIWQQLKAGLLGRELLSFGTEVIAGAEIVKESLTQSLFIENADINGIVTASNALEIPLQKIKPASVKLKVTTASEQHFAPFTLKFSIGSITFTNIDYVSSEEIIELYQGNVVSSFSNPAQGTANFLSLRVDNVKTWSNFYEFTTSEYYSKYIKLGTKALASSLRIFSKEGAVILPITEFNPLITDPALVLYKTRLGWDKSVNVLFGNGLWGAPLDYTTKSYQAIWLELTTSDFDPTQGTLKHTPQGSIIAEDLDFTLNSYSRSADEDLPWLRNKIRSENAKNSVIATKDQIKNFVKAFNSVIDCSVVRSTIKQNTLLIYVKPTTDNDTNFSFIEDNLILYGEQTTDYKVQKGVPFLFVILLSTPDIIDSGIKSLIVNYLQTLYSYETLEYSKQLNSSEISSAVSQFTDKSILVALQITEPLSEENKISFLPKPGTIELLLGNTVIGWDAAGLIYSKKAGTPQNFKDVIGTGDFLLCAGKDVQGKNRHLTTISPDGLLSINTDAALSALLSNDYSKLIAINTTTSYIGYAVQLLLSAEGIPSKKYKVVVYNNDASFENGDYSIQKYNTAYKPPVLNTIFDSSEITYFDPKNIIIVGQELYNVCIKGTLFIVQKWYYTTQWVQMYYDIQATVVDGLAIMGILEIEGDLFIITNQASSHFVLENYKDDPVLHKNVDLSGATGIDETELVKHTTQNSVVKVKDTIVWTTSDTGAVQLDDFIEESSIIELFGSENVLVPVNKSVTANVSLNSKIRIRLSAEILLNTGYTLTPTLMIVGAPATITTYFTIEQSTDPLYPKDRFLTLTPLSALADAEIQVQVTAVGPNLSSFINITLDVVDLNTNVQKMYTSTVPRFNKTVNGIVLSGDPIEVYTDSSIPAKSVNIPITKVNNILYVRMINSDSSDTECIAAWNMDTNTFLFFIKSGEVVASDGTSKITETQQSGTIDYATGTIALVNTLNYKFRYKIQSTGSTIDKANYPKLENVLWE